MAHTAWANKTGNDLGRVEMTFDLAVAGAAQGFSPVIDAIKVRSKSLAKGDKGSNGQYVAFSFNASAVTGTNLDIALYGAKKVGGNKALLLDALVADITATGKVTGIIDIQAYPASYYYISVTGDNAETGNTLAIEITGDLGGNQVSTATS
jgi:hypothetical protein